MRGFGEATHDLQHDGAADAVVPSFGYVAIVGENGEVGNGSNRIAGRDAESSDVGGGAGTGVEEEVLLLGMTLRIVRSDVCVPDVGDGKDRTFGAKDDPALIGKRSAQPVTEHLHRDESIGTNAANHTAKFVHVCIEHNARTGVALLSDNRAEAVVGDAVGVGLHAVRHEFADGLFEAGRAGSFGEFFEELHDPIWGWRLRRRCRLSTGGQHEAKES